MAAFCFNLCLIQFVDVLWKKRKRGNYQKFIRRFECSEFVPEIGKGAVRPDLRHDSSTSFRPTTSTLLPAPRYHCGKEKVDLDWILDFRNSTLSLYNRSFL